MILPTYLNNATAGGGDGVILTLLIEGDGIHLDRTDDAICFERHDERLTVGHFEEGIHIDSASVIDIGEELEAFSL